MRRRVNLNNPIEKAIVLKAMEYLNLNSRYSEHLYDCKELGLLQIYWGRGGWEYVWLKVDPLPEDISDFIEECRL